MSTSVTLADQITSVDAAAAPLRQRVTELAGELQQAITAAQFDRAAQIKPGLEAARAELVVAEAAVTALRQGAQAAEQSRADEERQIQHAQRRARAASDLADATRVEQEGLSELDSAIERMFAHLAHARSELRAALALQHRVGEARQRAFHARDAASDAPTGQVPTASSPNKASVLAEQDSLISQLARWTPSSLEPTGNRRL